MEVRLYAKYFLTDGLVASLSVFTAEITALIA
jgi:hypothetical protein